jgi:thiol-disulfide isomerase/thioredoxin
MTPVLVQAYLDAGDVPAAKLKLADFDSWKTSHPANADPKTKPDEVREMAAAYWESNERLAEVQKHTEEALAAAGKLLQFREWWDTTTERFAMIEKSKKLWIEAKETEDGWKEWLQGIKDARQTGWEKIEIPVSDFAFVDLKGKKWTQEDLKGRVTLLNFWATWCGPCVIEMPYMVQLQEALKGRQDVQVLAMSVDESSGLIEPFLKERHLDGLTVVPVGPDFGWKSLKLDGIPTTWIVDRDGVARKRQLGIAGDPAKWVKATLELLK